MRNKIKRIIICLSIPLIIMVSGCWDNVDINERTFVSAIGLDKGENGEISVTLQVLRPNVVRANIEEGATESVIWTSTTTGETVSSALRDQLELVSRKPFYNYLRIIFIGEELAKEGINDIIDCFLRNSEVRLIPKIFVTKNMEAKEMVAAESKLEVIPALHLEGILEINKEESKTRDVDLMGVIHDLSSAHGYGVIASIIKTSDKEVKNIKDVKIEGTAVLHKDKLIGYLDGEQTRGYLFIKNEVKGGSINVNNPIEEGKKVAIVIKDAKGEMKVDIEGEDLILKVSVKMKASIREQQGSKNLANQENISKLEKEVEEEIENRIKKVIEIGQKKYKYDFFGFSDKVYYKYPQYWDEIKDNWDEEFSNLPLETDIKVKIDRTGRVARPITIH